MLTEYRVMKKPEYPGSQLKIEKQSLVNLVSLLWG